MITHQCPPEVIARVQSIIESRSEWAWGLLANPRFDEIDQIWIFDNGEYACPILFCLWCGQPLESRGDQALDHEPALPFELTPEYVDMIENTGDNFRLVKVVRALVDEVKRLR